MATNEYYLVIIGADSGGLTTAGFAAQLGAKVALAEKHKIGGDCTWTGCVPSKALLKAANVAHEMTASHYDILTKPIASRLPKSPLDVIGHLHGCADELRTLLQVRSPGNVSGTRQDNVESRRAIRWTRRCEVIMFRMVAALYHACHAVAASMTGSGDFSSGHLFFRATYRHS